MTDWLDEPVTIHFTEDSIPGLRRGELTKESKAAIEKHLAEAVREARIEQLEKLTIYGGAYLNIQIVNKEIADLKREQG